MCSTVLAHSDMSSIGNTGATLWQVVEYIDELYVFHRLEWHPV